jgi:hypothetical protein
MGKNCHPNQFSLLDLLKDLRPKDTEFSSFNIDLRFRKALHDAIKSSHLSREQIAMKMSELLGREVTKDMIDSWTAESREGMNNIWAVNLPAFCHVVESIEPLRILADLNGCYVIQGPEALDLELKKIWDQRKILDERERSIKIHKQGMGK